MRAGSSDEDYARLHDYVEGLVESGISRLPPEPKLSELLEISRGRLRTLLKRLEDQGVIWRHVGKGTFIGPRQIKLDDRSWSASVSADDLMAARLLLEPQLAAQAAIHATPADIDIMDHCLSEMDSAPSFPMWKRLDERLHRAIAEATHNMPLVMLYDVLKSQVKLSLDRRMTEVFGVTREINTQTNSEHGALIEAIRAHNPVKAEEEMREHLRSVRARLFGIHS